MELQEFFRDEKAVEAGEWVGELTGVGDNVRFRVRGMTSKDYMNAYSRAQRRAPAKDREADRTLKLEAVQRIMADLLPEYILMDWEGITNEGKPLPYDKEKVKGWLRQPGALPLLNAIVEAAGRVDDKQAVVKSETVKNS